MIRTKKKRFDEIYTRISCCYYIYLYSMFKQNFFTKQEDEPKHDKFKPNLNRRKIKNIQGSDRGKEKED